MRGRHRKPTKLKILEGNPGKRALPKNEPQPTGDAVKPKWLTGRASRAWDELAPRFIAMGTLTDADSEEFARYCVLRAKLAKEKDAFPAAYHARLDALAAKFGMDPSSRARLGTTSRKPKQNPFAALA